MPIERLRLRAEETGGVNLRLELRRRRLRERARVGIALEQRRRDQVHALIGRLRREDRRDQQLEGVAVVELGVGVRMLRLERVEDVPRLGGGLHGRGFSAQ